MSNSKFTDYKLFPMGAPIAGSAMDPHCLGYVYVIGFEEPGVVKIGSARAPGIRLGELQCGNPFELRLLAAVGVYEGNATLIEFAAHRLAKDALIRGEWFQLETDEALAVIIKAARNAKAKFGAHSVALRATDEYCAKAAERHELAEAERRRAMRIRLGMEA